MSLTHSRLDEKEILKILRNSETMRNSITRWIVDNEYDKDYRKCNAGSSDECIGVGVRSEFHGRRCNACVNFHHRKCEAKRKAERKAERMNNK